MTTLVSRQGKHTKHGNLGTSPAHKLEGRMNMKIPGEHPGARTEGYFAGR